MNITPDNAKKIVNENKHDHQPARQHDGRRRLHHRQYRSPAWPPCSPPLLAARPAQTGARPAATLSRRRDPHLSPHDVHGNRPLCAERFDALLAKGQIAFSKKTRYVDVVDGHVDWSVPPGGLQGTCLVFIGAEFDEDALQKALAPCKQCIE